jgi:metal-responsive CopG/Arc/MetJ family transcriptional regulator
MRTTINIDDKTLEHLIHYTQVKNRAQAMRRAIEAFVAQAQMKELLALRGQVDIADDWQALRALDTAAL